MQKKLVPIWVKYLSVFILLVITFSCTLFGKQPEAPSELDVKETPEDPSEFYVDEQIAKLYLTWKDNSENEDAFILERRLEGTEYKNLAELDNNSEQYTDDDVEVGKTYYYRIKATNQAGDSEYSNEADGTPVQSTYNSLFFADHTVVEKLWTGQIPESAIQHAKDTLHIGYGHTSHGSQLSSGMTGLVSFANDGHLGTAYTHNLFERSQDGSGNTLHLFEGTGGWLSDDAGYYPQWVNETREFLDDPSHSEYNVIIWSWCGQVSSITEQNLIDEYLNPMTLLEADYPGVTFVYMTGHLNGTGEDGNLHLRNEQIRQFCIENDKWLYDFADIESYDPDGNYYLDRGGDDGCNYDGGNWATEWQDSHPEGEEWYDCYSAHSEPLNANMKAYAAWWLWTRLAGWDGN